MEQSPSQPLHVAFIMDGNGRWAAARNLPRIAGHRAGAETVRRVVEASPSLGIGTVTFYAFSSDNWKRPANEVGGLMRLFESFLRQEVRRCVENGVRLSVIGRRDRLPAPLPLLVERAERETAHCGQVHVRIAVDYSSRDAILNAARAGLTRAEMSARLGPDVDLVIRTSGEQRLSDFLLWECAYSEFCFTKTLWPDFGREELEAAIEDFRGRDRRYGALSAA